VKGDELLHEALSRSIIGAAIGGVLAAIVTHRRACSSFNHISASTPRNRTSILAGSRDSNSLLEQFGDHRQPAIRIVWITAAELKTKSRGAAGTAFPRRA
jgi:hypothetical protein